MGQREGFTGGFLAGAIVGGVVGGILGSVLASRSTKKLNEENQSFLHPGEGIKFDTEEDMELARRRLEDKIAQLNHAIDDVRQQLGAVNGNGFEEK